MIRGLIIGHRDIGESILRSLESISGEHEHISFLSNDGLSTKELSEKIKEFHSEFPDESLFIFIDVYGGSCWRAAKMAQLAGSHILTGVNLPMLLSFVNKRCSFPFDDLLHILETDGKRGIKSE